jgi:uncharacterized protein YciI
MRSIVRTVKHPNCGGSNPTPTTYVSAMMQYLYRITPTRLGMVAEGPTDEEAAIMSRHFDYLKSLTGQGTVLLFGRTQNSDATTFGIAIFRAESEVEARSIINNDPASRKR